jgi:hypothetical protein
MIKRICFALILFSTFVWNTANAAHTPCSTFWPSDGTGAHVLPVCYTAAQAARPGFSAWLPVARQAVESTWGRAANITFTGWRACPATPTGEIIVLDYGPGLSPGSVTCHAPGQPALTFQDPDAISTSNWAHTAVHEFGHLLGFKHEQDRVDNPYWTDHLISGADPSTGCSNVTASTPWTQPNSLFITSYDYYSIMNYCGEGYDLGVIADPFHYWLYANANRAELSPLDVNGVDWIYGRKPPRSIIAGNGLALTVTLNPAPNKYVLTLKSPNGGTSQTFDSSQGRIGSDYYYTGGNVLTTPGGNSLHWGAAANGAATLTKIGMRWITGGNNCVVPDSATAGSLLSDMIACDTHANQTWDVDQPFTGNIRLSGTNLCAWHGGALGNQLQLAACPGAPDVAFTFVEGHSMVMSASGYCVQSIFNPSSFGLGLVQCPGIVADWQTMFFRGPITAPDLGKCLTSATQGDGTLRGPAACDGSLQQQWDFHLRQDYNLALGQYAYQSSTYYGGDASRAVDGNTDGNFWDASVSLTNYDAYAWWAVWLGGVHEVHSVDIYNRTDWGTEVLSHFNVYAWNDAGSYWYVIADYSSYDTSGKGLIHVPVPATSTQYIMIQKTDTNYLQLAEVQVIGK